MRKIILVAIITSIACTACSLVDEKGSLTTETECAILGVSAATYWVMQRAAKAELIEDVAARDAAIRDANLRAQAIADKEMTARHALLRQSLIHESEMQSRRDRSEITGAALRDARLKTKQMMANCLQRRVSDESYDEDLKDCIALGVNLGDAEERGYWTTIKENRAAMLAAALEKALADVPKEKTKEEIDAEKLYDYRHLRNCWERIQKIQLLKDSVMATEGEHTKSMDDLVAAMEKCLGNNIGTRRNDWELNGIFRDCIANGVRLDDEEERAEWMKIREIFLARNEKFFKF